MKLKNIIKNVKTVKTYGSLDIEITNLTSDSRNIKPSGLFFAIKGYALDGTKFIKSAIENGAISVVIDTTTDIQSLEIPSGITIVVVEDEGLIDIAQSLQMNGREKQIGLINITNKHEGGGWERGK